jgi:hypothetical protein
VQGGRGKGKSSVLTMLTMFHSCHLFCDKFDDFSLRHSFAHTPPSTKTKSLPAQFPVGVQGV